MRDLTMNFLFRSISCNYSFILGGLNLENNDMKLILNEENKYKIFNYSNQLFL